MDDSKKPEAGAPVVATSAPRKSGLPLLAILAIVIVIVVGGGTAAAFTLPVVQVQASVDLAGMLPSTTAMYVAFDLNPSGDTKTDLDRIMRTFSSQPGWKNIAKTFNQGTHSTASTGQCYNQTSDQAFQHLDWLGHDTAVALVSTAGLSTQGSSSKDLKGLKRDAVLLAPLDVHETLAGALSGFHVSLPSADLSYQGTTIYRESFDSCGKVSSGSADAVYAAVVKGYVVLGLSSAPLKTVIDVSGGRQTALASSSAYQQLVGSLPGNQLGSYYLNASALKRLGLSRAVAGTPAAGFVPGGSLESVTQSTAGSLSVDASGFRFTAVAPTISHSSGKSAALLAAKLPSDTLALISARGIQKAIKSAVKSVSQSGALGSAPDTRALIKDLVDPMSGETDLVIFKPNGKLKLNLDNPDLTLPVALLWQVSSDSGARDGIDAYLHRLGAQKEFKPRTQAGTSFEATGDGYGYSVNGGWAVASLSIARALGDLSHSGTGSLASSPAFKEAVPTGSSPSTVWYFNLHGLRTQIENALLPSLPKATRTMYRKDVRPVLAPLSILAGSASTAGANGVDTTTVSLTIK